ncbi:MAG: CoA transferase [Chloroflexi bacterium]|nr:CoA transferase [Chloroflexota bacterium]
MGALDGVRVLDLSIIVQGPQAAAMLHDLGAEVVKVELPVVGDLARWIAISPEDPRSAYFFALNRGKRSVTLDLRTEGGKTALRRLVEGADVIISNFKPGTMEAWGLGYEELSAVNPRLIYGAASALGPVGLDAEREGADLTGQAIGGLISTTGVDGSLPTPVGAVVADHCGSQNLVVGILAALYARERTGRGQRVEVSLLGGQIWAQASELTHHLLSGKPAGRANHGNPMIHAIYRVFSTADGQIGIVGVPAALWSGFCRAIDRPDLADNPRYMQLFLDAERKAEIFALLDEIFKTRTTGEWCARMHAEGQRFAPVRDHAQVAVDPGAWENGYFVTVQHPEWGSIPAIGSPIRFSETPTTPGSVAPELGQHTEEVLLEHGFTWDDIAKLREQGAW